MRRSPYEVLGVKPQATASEIKASYRQLALKYHPDTSKDPKASDKFIEVAEAYEVLGDPHRRREFDRLQAINAELRKAKPAAKPPPRQAPKPPQPAPKRQAPQRPALRQELDRLAALLSRGNLGEAEALAKSILSTEPKQPMPYAVLGDIARSRGDLKLAAKMYAYAAQFDPTNTIYLRKYEQLLDRINQSPVRSSRPGQAEKPSIAPFVGFGMTLVGACYVAVSPETAVFTGNSLVSTWTLGLMVMTFLCGVIVGASMAIGNLVDRFSATTTTATGGVSPSVALMTVAIVSFWAAVGLYAVIGSAQRAWVLSITRISMAVAAVTLIMTLGASMSGSIAPDQVFLWGGNLAYVGCICGWMVADSFRS